MVNKSMFEPSTLSVWLRVKKVCTLCAANMASSIPGAKWFDKLVR